MSAHRIKKRITFLGRGAVFTPASFLDLGTRASVDQALSRLVRKGFIRRLMRGLYDFPKFHPELGILSPSAYDIANAMAERGGFRLLITSDAAANYFGLTTQVPAKPRYLTDGPTRIYTAGTQIIKVKHASARTMVGAGRASGTVFQALRHLGVKRVNDASLKKIARYLTAEEKKVIHRDSQATHLWIQKAVEKIMGIIYLLTHWVSQVYGSELSTYHPSFEGH